MKAAESRETRSVCFDLDIRDVEAYQDEPLTWNTVVADCSSYDSATTENDGEVEMQGKRRSACCLHSNLSDADWIADAKVLLLNWSATTLWLLSSFAGTFLRCRWWITSVDDHVGHNNVVPERIPVPSRTTIPQDATKSDSGQRPGSDTVSYESGGEPCPVWGGAWPLWPPPGYATEPGYAERLSISK